MTAEDLQRLLIEGPPAARLEPKDIEAERRTIAIGLASRMVIEGRLPAWELFDYAHGLLQFLNTGTPFRFEKGTLEGVPAEQQIDFTRHVM